MPARPPGERGDWSPLPSQPRLALRQPRVQHPGPGPTPDVVVLPAPGLPRSLRHGAGAAMSEPRPIASASAFVEDLFARHNTEIYAFLVRMLRDDELAADLAQDTFVKAYRAYDHLGPPDNARAWLYQIAHRVALDELRRRKIVRFLPWIGESRGAAPSAEHLAMDVRLSGPLARALERIPERQRAALLLAELHDLTGLELATALGVSHVAARALLTRARDSLRRALATEQAAEQEAERRADERAGGSSQGTTRSAGGRGGRASRPAKGGSR